MNEAVVIINFYFIVDDEICQLFIKCQLTLTRCREGMEETIKKNIMSFFSYFVHNGFVRHQKNQC